MSTPEDKKPYLVLARKYRPRDFDAIIGQDAVSTTLKNAIKLGRIGHAYLFTGPRGVGKTSTARIFAKALNCKKGPTAKPCGECVNCAEIDATRSLDVQEIDGASNRGIDEIRALRENVKFAPVSGRFKIYIIDEVHQITPDAFNALLKTLEEPPPHVKFIFATTSPQKVPATILSRCQRFDFRRIPTAEIAAALKDICKKEKIKADDDALLLVAKAADGSLRDSQSILDQLWAQSPERVTLEAVSGAFGSLDEERLLELGEALASRDAKAALEWLDRAVTEGKDPQSLLEKALEHVRNLLFLRTSEKLIELIDATESYREGLMSQAKRFSKDDLFYAFSAITHAVQVMRRFEQKRVPIEVMLVKLCEGAPLKPLAEVLEVLKASPVPVPAPVTPTAAEPTLPRKTARRRADEERDEPDTEDLPPPDAEIAPAAKRGGPAPGETASSFEALWQPLLSAVKSEKISLASYLAEGEPSGLRNGVARIAFPERHSFHRETLELPDNRRLIEKHLSQLLGQAVRIEFESVKEIRGGGEGPAKSPDTPSAASQEILKSASNLFGGKVIH